MEDAKRSVFGIDGVAGMLIATALLLGILAYLTVLAIGAQQTNSEKFYKLENEKQIKMIGKENAAHRVVVK